MLASSICGKDAQSVEAVLRSEIATHIEGSQSKKRVLVLFGVKLGGQERFVVALAHEVPTEGVRILRPNPLAGCM